MEKFDFVREEILSLIRNLKKQDYLAAKYLEDNIQFIENGDIKFNGSKDKILRILKRALVKN